jgi:hypothetical protein
MANVSQVGNVPDDQYVSRAETAAQLAEDAQVAADAAAAAAQQAYADTVAALALQNIGDHNDTTIAALSAGDLLKWNGSAWVNETVALDELSDVTAPSPSLNDALSWNGSAWVPANVAAITGALPISGGTMTGTLTLAGDPVLAAEAATKSYVDNALTGDSPYDFGIFFDGVPASLEDIFRVVCVRNFYLRQNLPVSQGFSRVAATAQTDFDIQKNSVSIGTIRWAAAATVATFIFAADVPFTSGDRLQIIAPATADLTLEDISITLAGVLGIVI